jgi:ATP-dependent helicase/nuclease subunit B
MSIELIVKSFAVTPSVWLIPYAQLKATARGAWEEMYPTRVTPQIMTVREWASSLGVVAKAPTDLQFDAGIDRLIAESQLKSAGLEASPALVQRLLDMVADASHALAAVHPSRRLAWASERAGLFQQGGQFQLEGAIGWIALMWAAAGSFDTDVLWHKQGRLLGACEHIYFTPGLQNEPLLQALLGADSQKTTLIDLGIVPRGNTGLIDEYLAADFEDLVQQTAAVILASPDKTIALVALDRQLTRRLSAVLSNRGVALVDETGWTLSTAAVAAKLMAWLEAMSRKATSDQVLAALKSAPLRFLPADVSQLEQKIRRESQVDWSKTGSALLGDWPLRFARARPLTAWLQETKLLLQDVGLWDIMQADLAGEAMLKAMHVDDATVDVYKAAMPRSAYVAWVRAVLEANRFRLSFDAKRAQGTAAVVTILPLAQMWGRHFDAVVVPSCDEKRLPARPRQQSDWSAAQREALGLPTADDTATSHTKAWAWLCSQPKVSLLWQQMEGSESLSKSILLQLLEVEGRLVRQGSQLVATVPSTSSGRADQAEGTAMAQRAVGTAQSHGAMPVLDVCGQGVAIDWQTLAPATLSASAYADLRACPYRFYATRILGLHDADELDETLDKRDFGLWLHGTLYRFHEALKNHRHAQVEQPLANVPASTEASSLEASFLEALLDRCAAAEQQHLGLDEAAFLPISLIWPKTRKAYLTWLAQHEAGGAQYEAGEVKKTLPLAVAGKTVHLVGTLDRIDTDTKNHVRWLLDYKTESVDKTKKRIKNAGEDTQLAFYAALVSNDTENIQAPPRGAYINLVERTNGKTGGTTHELFQLVNRRNSLLDGIRSDLLKMATGHGLRALGEGDACTYCQVRGICRKDFV